MSDAVSGKAIVKALNGKADVHEAVGNISAAGELRAWAARIERGDFSITSPAEGEWKTISEVMQRENAQLHDEVRRLRAALEAIEEEMTDDTSPRAQRINRIINEALSTTNEPTGAERVREPVAWFAQRMEAKLRENDHKGGWENESIDWLIDRLIEEVFELRREVYPPMITRQVIREAADVANFAMMIADIARRINAPKKEG